MNRIAAALFSCALLQAAVTRVEVTGRADAPLKNYERVNGKVYFAVDPRLAANQIVTDLALAPKNAKGLVEFSADFYMLRPKDSSKGNGTALVEIPNRGGRGMLGTFDLAARGEDFSGDPLVFEQGFTLVWIGWQFDVATPGALKLYTPVLAGVTGPVHSEIVVDRKATSAPVGDSAAMVAYAQADPAAAVLTVRDQPQGPRTTIPRASWRFSSDGQSIELDAGFEPGRIYEAVYQAKDPAVVGLGPAAVRDYISYLKQQGEVKRAIGFGTSQSGRFLRTFLYYGFNADESGKRVFDGVWAHVAGGGRGSFNHRFAQPSRDVQPRRNLLYPTVMFPFTDDPESDGPITDALLARAVKDRVVPKIFYTNGSHEYWGRSASLIHISVDGKKDIAPSHDTRIYYFAGTQHTANSPPARTATQNLTNPMDYRLAQRALLLALNAWVTDGTAPPESRIPRVGEGELVPSASVKFPKIPGISVPESNHGFHLDFGPEFRTKGIVTFEPPKVAAAFPALVPQVDADGNETTGVRLPDQRVPLATYTGWNLRAASLGAGGTLVNEIGSMIPFALTKAEREASGDPRPSIQERYKGLDEYLGRVEVAAKLSVREGFLLERDVTLAVSKARQRWTSITTPSAAQ